MKFLWMMSEKDYKDYRKHQHEFDDKEIEGTYIGALRAGDLCFDILNWGNHLWFDLYVGGVDTGYGYSSKEGFKGYPYDFCDSVSFCNKTDVQNISFEDFKKMIGKFVQEHLAENSSYDVKGKHIDLLKKANSKLKMW